MKRKSKKKVELSEATRTWIRKYVRCYDEDTQQLPLLVPYTGYYFIQCFEYDEDGKIFYNYEKATGKTDPSEGVREIAISGDLRNFKDADGKLVKFANVDGLFSIEDCPNLTDLSGAPDEVYSSYDGNSEFVIRRCPSLKVWKKEYISGGAENLTIEFCENLKNILLTGSYENIFISNLDQLDKFELKNDGAYGTSIYLSTCKSIEIESIDLPKTKCKISIDACPKIIVELEEADVKEFEILKGSKNLQKAKKLGLF
jgi:hypothetical protein